MADKEKTLVHIRRFLRPKGDTWGEESTLHFSLSRREYRRRLLDVSGDDSEATRKSGPTIGAIDCGIGIRDCSDSIQLDLSCSQKIRHAEKQKKVLHKLIDDLIKVEVNYGEEIDRMKEAGLLT